MTTRETAGNVTRADAGSIAFYNYINLYLGDVLVLEGVDGEEFLQEITGLMLEYRSVDWVHNDAWGEVLMSVDQPVKPGSMIYLHARGPNASGETRISRLP